MRLCYFLLVFSLIFCVGNLVFSQVGINTTDPKGLLDIVSPTNADNTIIFTKDGNLGVGTTDPKTKLDVEGTMQIKKSKTETNDINSYIFTSDENGSGSWKYKAIAQQNLVSTFEIELSVKNLFDTETRFTVTSIPRNELNLSPSTLGYFDVSPIPNGIYAIIINLEQTNANSIATFALSTTSSTIPLSGGVLGNITMSGRKLSTSLLVNLNQTNTLNNHIYIVLTQRTKALYSSNWTNFTYWNKPWEALASGENYIIKGTIDIIKLG